MPTEEYLLNIKVSSSQDAEILVSIPGRVGNMISNLNICSIFPLNVAMRIMDKCSAKILSLGVCLIGPLSMSIGKWLLDLHVDNIEGIVGTIRGRTISIIRQTKELSANFLAVGIKGFNVTETNTWDIVPRSTTNAIYVGSTGYSIENIRNCIIGVIE